MPDLIDPELANLGHILELVRVETVLGKTLSEDRVGKADLGADTCVDEYQQRCGY